MTRAADIDVIIGGGGVAGAATAAAMHQIGLNVLVIEPSVNDRRRLAGELIHPPGVMGLAELGLLDALKRAPAVTVAGFSVFPAKPDGDRIRLPYDSVPGHRTLGLSLEHCLIRQNLLTHTESLPGVRVMRGARVVGVDQSDASFVTVDVARGDELARYRCRLLVAADGASSRIARLAGMDIRKRRVSTIFGYRLSAGSLPEPTHGHIFLGAHAPILAYPIDGNYARILYDLPFGADRRANAAECAAMSAGLPPSLRQQAEESLATQSPMSVVAQATTADRLASGRVVLVGDAGGSCHPLTATGMTMCIRDALMLRDAVQEAAGNVAAALKLYQRRRCRPQMTRVALADALRDVLCASSPALQVARDGILAHWRSGAAAQAAGMALLSTADGRLSALFRQIAIVMGRGYIAHIRRPRPVDGHSPADSVQIIVGLLGIFARHIKAAVKSRNPIRWPSPKNLHPPMRKLSLIRRFNSLIGL
jgi:squalene monooxygenase